MSTVSSGLRFMLQQLADRFQPGPSSRLRNFSASVYVTADIHASAWITALPRGCELYSAPGLTSHGACRNSATPVYCIPRRSFNSYAPHVMQANKNLTEIVSEDTTDQTDDSFYLICAWGRYLERSDDASMRADFYGLLSNRPGLKHVG